MLERIKDWIISEGIILLTIAAFVIISNHYIPKLSIFSRKRKVDETVNSIFNAEKFLTVEEICNKWARKVHPNNRFRWDDIAKMLIIALRYNEISFTGGTRESKEYNKSILYEMCPEIFERDFNCIHFLHDKELSPKKDWILNLIINREEFKKFLEYKIKYRPEIMVS